MDVAKGVVGHFMNYNKSDIWSQTSQFGILGLFVGSPTKKIFMRNQRFYQRFHLKSSLKNTFTKIIFPFECLFGND